MWTQISSFGDSKVPRSINKAPHRWYVIANGNTVTINWRHYGLHTSTDARSRIRLRLELRSSVFVLADSLDYNWWVLKFFLLFTSINSWLRCEDFLCFSVKCGCENWYFCQAERKIPRKLHLDSSTNSVMWDVWLNLELIFSYVKRGGRSIISCHPNKIFRWHPSFIMTEKSCLLPNFGELETWAARLWGGFCVQFSSSWSKS